MKKNVFITGTSRGIGRAIAQRFKDNGFNIIAPGRNDMDLSYAESVLDYLRLHPDLSVDILVNNAGENRLSPINQLSLNQWRMIHAVNLDSPLLLIKEFSRNMMEKKWGRIVNISSFYSLVTREARAAYSSSKAALNALTRTACLEYGPYNVLINSVCPGFVSTEMTTRNNSEEEIELLCKQIPLGRLAKPSEIAELVYFLCSERNTYITGQSIVIDGGFMNR